MKKIIISILILVGLGIFAYYFFFPASDEAKVKNQFARLAGYAGKSTGEKTSSMVIKTQAISYLFNDPCTLTVPNTFLSGDYTNNEITSNAARARSQFKNVSLKFYDLDIDIIDENNAKAIFTARLVGNLKSGGRVQETREMCAILKKVDKKWLFTEFKVIEVLKK